MSVPTPIPKVTLTSSEVLDYIRKHGMSRTKADITTASNALRKQKQKDSLPTGREVAVNVQDGPRHVIYGECRVGGQFVFLSGRSNNQYFDVVVAIAGHEINQVMGVYLDDARLSFTSVPGWNTAIVLPDGTSVPNGANKVYVQVNNGSDSQAALSQLVANNPSKWTSAYRGLGVAHVYLQFVWDSAIWGDGLPDITFQVQGKKVRDPRTGTTYYTPNSALCAADYITDSRIGFGSSVSRIDDTSLSAAADDCDENVTLKDGSTEKRYTTNGWFTLDETPGRILERMSATMGGHITYTNGKWKFWPAKYRAPAITITEDDLRGPLKIQTLAGRSEIFNSVRGTFVSAAKGYVETDYAAIWNEGYRVADGETIWQNIDYNFVTSEATCARLSKIELERVRQGIQIDVDVSLKGFLVQVPETVALTLSRYGWTAKEFEVMRCDLVLRAGTNGPPEIVVSMSLRETASGVYNWNYWEATIGDVAPNTNLPSPFAITAPGGVALSSGTSDLYMRGDGVIAPRIKVSWTAYDDFFVSSGGTIEIQFKPSSSGTWLDNTAVPGSSSIAYISDVRDGVNYDVRVRAVNAFRVASDYVTISNYFVVGKTAPPSDVTGFAGAITGTGIQLAWNAIADFDADLYEIREGASWTTPTLTWQTRATRLQLDLRSSGTKTFFVKAIDTTGNYSTNATSCSVVIVAPSVTSGVATFNGPDCVLNWTDVPGSWALDGYFIYHGTTFGSATSLGFSKSTTFSIKATWSGLRRFWVQPRDIYGNLGTQLSIDATLTTLSAVTSLIGKVIDNNVFLTWATAVGGTLPVEYYKIYKGATFGGATLIGQTATTFTSLSEETSGTYVYWVVPYDTAGNAGTETSTTNSVDKPPDFTLITNQDLTLASATTLTNCLVDTDGSLLLPVNKTETWADHFVNNSWTTPDAQVTAGYSLYIQPTPSTAQYVQQHDVGTTITAGCLVSAIVQSANITGSITLTPTISVAPDSGGSPGTWRDYAGVYSVFESNFRFIKIKLDASGGGTALKRISKVTITAAVKLKRDSGSMTCLASDASGTTQNFGVTFYDIVGSPQLTTTDLIRAASIYNGSSNYLSHTNHADLGPRATDWSFNGWFYFLPGYMLSTQVLGGVFTAGAMEWLLYYDASGGLIRFGASTNGTSIGYQVSATNFGAIAPGSWVNISALVNTTTDELGIRINRTAYQSVALSTAVATTATAFRVGCDAAGGSPGYFLCKNLAIWKSRALATADMDELYDEGFQKYSELSAGMKTSMVMFQEMNESSGTRTDADGTHNLTQNGTVSGQILPLIPFTDFTDVANPTNFKGFVLTESQVRVSSKCSWYADGYAALG